MPVRNLLVLVLVVAAAWWLRRIWRRSRMRAQQDAPAIPAPERMRPCAHCGVHVPESEGVRAGERFFCCDEHRRAAVDRG